MEATAAKAEMTSDSGGPADFSVRFWGVRGSIASPGNETARYGGNTSCLEVICGGTRLVFDAGTGIRALGDTLVRQGPVDLDLFFTHTHFDHICGLPFFAPAYQPQSRLRLWAGHLPPGQTLHAVVSSLMSAPLFPVPVEIMSAAIEFKEFTGGTLLHRPGGITLKTALLNHPNGAVGYRISFASRSICYVTDTEHYAGRRDPAVVELVRDADVMIYDCTYTDDEYGARIGWGHSTWQECLRIADAANVGRAVIFHHDPSRYDTDLDVIAAQAEQQRPGTLVAREGLILSV